MVSPSPSLLISRPWKWYTCCTHTHTSTHWYTTNPLLEGTSASFSSVLWQSRVLSLSNTITNQVTDLISNEETKCAEILITGVSLSTCSLVPYILPEGRERSSFLSRAHSGLYSLSGSGFVSKLCDFASLCSLGSPEFWGSNLHNPSSALLLSVLFWGWLDFNCKTTAKPSKLWENCTDQGRAHPQSPLSVPYPSPQRKSFA